MHFDITTLDDVKDSIKVSFLPHLQTRENNFHSWFRFRLLCFLTGLENSRHVLDQSEGK